jgi:uncharacterized protein (DUF58 family)
VDLAGARDVVPRVSEARRQRPRPGELAAGAARSIHWKSLPKLRSPMVKQFQETLDREFWLDWDELTETDPEARLSQLARWVLEAEGSHLSYGLRLPGARIAPSRGATHQHACLKALALFES